MQLRKDVEEQQTLPLQSEKAFRLSVFPGSVADTRKVGLGHGNLRKDASWKKRQSASAFLAGHESFAAAEGAIGIAEKANKVRKKPLRVILNGLGKDAAQIISRINGFTYVETEYDPYTNDSKGSIPKDLYSDGLRAKVNCYGANDVSGRCCHHAQRRC